MTPAISLYLDAVRFTAAMTVFLGHIGAAVDPQFIQPGLARWLSGFSACMDEAVVIFFVLSGFVIAHATRGDRVASPTAYAVARLARIYSVALPALVATFLLDLAGRAIRPEIYQPFQPEQFLGALFFLNQLWYVDTGVGSNGPYWSLNYEVWYYLLFGMALFLQGWRRLLGMAAVLLLCGPQISLYFLIWLAGVWLYRITQQVRPGQGVGLLLALGGPLVFAGAASQGVPGEATMLHLLAPVLRDSNILHDAVVAAAFAAHLLGMHALSARLEGPLGAVAGPVRWLAGATFTVYLFHMPISRFLVAVLPSPPGAWAAPVILGGGFLAMLGIAAVTERRKQAWQQLFAALLGGGRRPQGAG